MQGSAGRAGVRNRRAWVRWGGLVAGLVIIALLVWTVVDAWDVVTSFDWQPSAGWLVLSVVLALASLTLSALAYEAILGGLHRPAPPRRAPCSLPECVLPQWQPPPVH